MIMKSLEETSLNLKQSRKILKKIKIWDTCMLKKQKPLLI